MTNTTARQVAGLRPNSDGERTIMLIAQISDPHITPPGEKAYGVAPTADSLALCIQNINQIEPKLDIVLVTGDITNDGKVESAEHAKSLLSNLNCPYFITPGNHDSRDVLISVFKDQIGEPQEDFINYVIDEHELRLVAIDTKRAGFPGGELCAKRLSWLEDRLLEDEQRPTIIFMHHPPVECGVLETDEDGFEGAEKLGRLIARFNNIKALVCGHIHLPTCTAWHGAIVSTAPSTGMKLSLDLTMQRPSEFFLGAPGYQLHYFSKNKNLVTHTIDVRTNYDGPYPFEDHLSLVSNGVNSQ